MMSFTFPGLIWIVTLLCLLNHCEGDFCPRTNPDPNRNCVDECIQSLDNCRRGEKCLCDGDCGYSCIKRNLDCGTVFPQRLSNGQRSVSGTKFNDSATFRCDPGYTLTGSSLRTCRGKGAWDGAKPRCKIFCSDPGIRNHSRRMMPRRTKFKTGTILRYYCIPNFQVVGSHPNIACLSTGGWSHPAPQCEPIPGRKIITTGPDCSSPTLPPNSELKPPKSYASGGKFGERLYLSCKLGYSRLGGDDFIVCNASGKWQYNRRLKCLPKSCGDPGIPKNGRRMGLLFHFNKNVSFACDECYVLAGPSYRICLSNQQWSDTQPSCQRATGQCKNLVNPRNGQVRYSSTNCGAKAMYSCSKSYKLIGDTTRRCDERGQWAGQTPRCEKITCGDPGNLNAAGLKPNYKDFNYGSTITFECKADYVIEGKVSMTCQEDGKWSGKVPVCLAPCPAVSSLNLRSKKKVYQSGEKGQHYCVSGYVLHGVINNENPACDNGKWSSRSKPILKCVEAKASQNENKNFWKIFKQGTGKSG